MRAALIFCAVAQKLSAEPFLKLDELSMTQGASAAVLKCELYRFLQLTLRQRARFLAPYKNGMTEIRQGIRASWCKQLSKDNDSSPFRREALLGAAVAHVA